MSDAPDPRSRGLTEFWRTNARPTLRHSAIPKPDPVPTPTPRTPSSAYARCDDCGTGQGEPCYDSHDRPCAPCPGRVLAPSASYVKRERAQRSSDRPKPPPRKSRPPPRSTACAFCGAGMRSDGVYCNDAPCQREKFRVQREARRLCLGCQCPIEIRRRWCDADACQTERRRRKDAEAEARRHAMPIPCCVCGVMVPGRSDHATRPICGAIDCKRRRQCELRQEHRSRVRARSRSTTPREEIQHRDA